MNRQIFAVYDSVSAEIFGPLLLLANEAAARRLFQDALFGQGSQLASHPQDYDLYHLGTFDTETGQIAQALEEPFCDASPVVTGAEVVRLVSKQRSNGAQLDIEDELEDVHQEEVTHG